MIDVKTITKPDRSIYLDACSTTPPLKEVTELICDIQRHCWGNPSSLHTDGILAAEILERARHSIAQSLTSLPEEIVFTSGATESIHLALKGIANNLNPSRIVVSSVEHPAVIKAAQSLERDGWEVAYWPVDSNGVVDLNYLDEYLEQPTKILSVVWGQSEVGTTQPIHLLGQKCRERGILFHTDATQILSNGIFDWSTLPVDLLSASSHKFQGPKGVGLLLSKQSIQPLLRPIQSGGSQEHGFRSGTEAVPLVAGTALALSQIKGKITVENNMPIFPETKTKLITKELNFALKQIKGLHFTGHSVYRLPNLISILVASNSNKPISGRRIVYELAKRGVSVSSGTACSSGIAEDSPVLKSIGVDKRFRQSGLRLSLGSWINSSDIKRIPELLVESISSIM